MLRTTLSQIWTNIQYHLFPLQEEELEPLSLAHKKLISVLELIKIEHVIARYYDSHRVGRPSKDRMALARAFIAKVVFKLEYTNLLRDFLLSDKQLRRICGWESKNQIPSESTFSRAFEEFALVNLPDEVHASLIKDLYEGVMVGHVTRDSTPVEAREKAIKKPKVPAIKKEPKKPGRPKKGHEKPQELTRIEKQASGKISFEEMVKDLPKFCDIGKKKSPSGHHLVWKGYKLHVAIDDNCVPLAAIVTSASLQDNQAAIPLGIKSNKVAQNFYDLMDANYDVKGIFAHSRSIGHVPIIDERPANTQQKEAKKTEGKCRKAINWQPAEEIRYGLRRKSERFNALFKDYYGGRIVRYRGYRKANCHLMFGVLTLAAYLLIGLVQ